MESMLLLAGRIGPQGIIGECISKAHTVLYQACAAVRIERLLLDIVQVRSKMRSYSSSRRDKHQPHPPAPREIWLFQMGANENEAVLVRGPASVCVTSFASLANQSTFSDKDALKFLGRQLSLPEQNVLRLGSWTKANNSHTNKSQDFEIAQLHATVHGRRTR
jgi:hypothetical protein